MRATIILVAVFSFMLITCQQGTEIIDEGQFKLLMTKLADSWTTQNTDSGVNCFARDAIYMQPPDEQLYVGHEQLRPFFGALKEGTVMKFHNMWFDKESQSGVAEFTFANSLSDKAVTGVAIIKVENGKIKTWREYFISGPADFATFLSTKNKNWKWTIKNYP